MVNLGTTENRASVAVVDDDESTRALLRDFVASSQSFRFAGEFGTAREALVGIPLLQSQLVLLDIQLGDSSGIECAKRLRRVMPGLKIIIFTGAHDPKWATASFEAGAAAYLVKPFSENQLLATLTFAVATGNQGLYKVGPHPLNPEKLVLKLALSPRETQVLSALAEGLLYKEISEKLGISYAAVHKHQHNIFVKLKVGNRSEAIRVWFERKKAESSFFQGL